MFNKPKPEPRTDAVIEKVLAHAQKITPGSDEFTKTVDQLDKLMKIEATEKPDRISRETLVTVAAHLVGIVMILGYEHAHPITSKALGFLPKPR